MPYTMEDFRKEVTKEVLDSLTPKELELLTPEQQAKLAQKLSVQVRLQGLSPEEIEAHLKKLKGEASDDNTANGDAGQE